MPILVEHPAVQRVASGARLRARRAVRRAPRRDVRPRVQGATDDLRESPFVELAERLIGKGFELKIHDPIVSPARLVRLEQALRGDGAAASLGAARGPAGRGRGARSDAASSAAARRRYSSACARAATALSSTSYGCPNACPRSRAGTPASPGRTAILVENLSVPFDRRVWQEAGRCARRATGVRHLPPRRTEDRGCSSTSTASTSTGIR